MNWRIVAVISVAGAVLSALLTWLMLSLHTDFAVLSLVMIPVVFAGFIVVSLLRAVFR